MAPRLLFLMVAALLAVSSSALSSRAPMVVVRRRGSSSSTSTRLHHHHHHQRQGREPETFQPFEASAPTTDEPASAAPIQAALVVATAAAVALPLPALASEYWFAGPVRSVADPLLLLGQFAMLLRTVMSWDPAINPAKMPYLLITFPTEPFLLPTRKVIPPAFGVDISPIVWVGILSFFREILFGQQGLFVLMERS